MEASESQMHSLIVNDDEKFMSTHDDSTRRKTKSSSPSTFTNTSNTTIITTNNSKMMKIICLSLIVFASIFILPHANNDSPTSDHDTHTQIDHEDIMTKNNNVQSLNTSSIDHSDNLLSHHTPTTTTTLNYNNNDASIKNNRTSIIPEEEEKELILTCPDVTQIGKSLNDNDIISLDQFYQESGTTTSITATNNKVQSTNTTSTNTQTSNQTKLLSLDEIENLKQHEFDGWSRNYYKSKELKSDWVKRFFQSLQSGDSIFESACGIGFNLLMTVEILYEELGIDNLNVYGIEYVQTSVDNANAILDSALSTTSSNPSTKSPNINTTTGGAKLASPICKGDATDLFFIPSNSFDLVFTGYIDPIVDPLQLYKELGRKMKASDLCSTTTTTSTHSNSNKETKNEWARIKLKKLDQRAQEDWYASWVSEMIRIAKRGKPIIIEEVSLPLCSSPHDWGGVARKWWKEAVLRYDWDVDLYSIHTEPVSVEKKTRYNVFMRKNL